MEEEITEDDDGREKRCQTIVLSGDRAGEICDRVAKYPNGKCGHHRIRNIKKEEKKTKEKEKEEEEEETSVGVSSKRKVDVVLLSGKTYVCNVKNSSKDGGAWKTFWTTHTGLEYPKTCRAKDCEKIATATGHMYLRTEYEETPDVLPKYNYLIPICSHHNSKIYDIKFFLVKKTTTAVKILENKNIHK